MSPYRSQAVLVKLEPEDLPKVGDVVRIKSGIGRAMTIASIDNEIAICYRAYHPVYDGNRSGRKETYDDFIVNALPLCVLEKCKKDD